MALILCLDLTGEMLDDLTVAHEQKVITVRHGRAHLGEEDTHVLVAMTLAGRVIFRRRTTG